LMQYLIIIRMFYYIANFRFFKKIKFHSDINITLRPHRRSRRRNFFRRRLRETQPKKRVPRTRFFRFISSTILFSEELEVPSRNIVDLRERVISAR
jgi:hypothetical protein